MRTISDHLPQPAGGQTDHLVLVPDPLCGAVLTAGGRESDHLRLSSTFFDRANCGASGRLGFGVAFPPWCAHRALPAAGWGFAPAERLRRQDGALTGGQRENSARAAPYIERPVSEGCRHVIAQLCETAEDADWSTPSHPFFCPSSCPDTNRAAEISGLRHQRMELPPECHPLRKPSASVTSQAVWAVSYPQSVLSA